MARRSIKLIDVNLEDTGARTFILFVQTADAVRKYADASLYMAGLSLMKFLVLEILAVNGGTMTPSEIAEWTLRERHNITTLVRRLERDELVRTQRSSTDRRFVHVTLTDKGRQVLSQVMPVARDVVKQIMSSVTDGHTAALEESLRILRRNAHHGLEHVTKRPQCQPD